MKQSNTGRKLKAFFAVALVMVSLFSISTAVSAGFVQEVFEEVCELMTTSSSYTYEDHECNKGDLEYVINGVEYYSCSICGQIQFVP